MNVTAGQKSVEVINLIWFRVNNLFRVFGIHIQNCQWQQAQKHFPNVGLALSTYMFHPEFQRIFHPDGNMHRSSRDQNIPEEKYVAMINNAGFDRQSFDIVYLNSVVFLFARGRYSLSPIHTRKCCQPGTKIWDKQMGEFTSLLSYFVISWSFVFKLTIPFTAKQCLARKRKTKNKLATKSDTGLADCKWSLLRIQLTYLLITEIPSGQGD